MKNYFHHHNITKCNKWAYFIKKVMKLENSTIFNKKITMIQRIPTSSLRRFVELSHFLNRKTPFHKIVNSIESTQIV